MEPNVTLIASLFGAARDLSKSMAAGAASIAVGLLFELEARSVNNMGVCHSLMNEHGSALKCFGASRKLLTEVIGPGGAETGVALRNLNRSLRNGLQRKMKLQVGNQSFVFAETSAWSPQKLSMCLHNTHKIGRAHV